MLFRTQCRDCRRYIKGKCDKTKKHVDPKTQGCEYWQ